MTGMPFAIATKSGDVVLQETLDQFSIKDTSSVNDPFTAKKKVDVPEVLSKQAAEYTVYRIYGLVEPPYNPKSLLRFSEINTYHNRCCRTKAVDIGGLGSKITLLDKEETAQAKENAIILNKFRVLSEESIQNGEYDKQQIGWACLELIREGGLVTGLPQRFVNIPSHTIRIHNNKRKFMQTWNGIQVKWFKAFGARNEEGQKFDVHIDNGTEHPFDSLPPEKQANELIYNKEYTPKTTYYGVPSYISATKTMIGDQSAVEYNLVFFKNFGIPAYAIYVTGNFKDEAVLDERETINGQPNPDYKKPTGKTKMQLAMEGKFKQVLKNPHSGMFFMIPSKGESNEVKITFEKLSVDTKESSFRLYRLDNRDEIVTAHGVDPFRIGITQTGSLGGNTAIENKKSYKSSIAIPGQRRWESLINKIIWSEDGFNIQTHKFELEEIDLEDQTALIDTTIKMVQNGLMSPNDFIRVAGNKYGLEKVDHPAMNAHYLNGYPIDYIPEGSEPLPLEVVKALKDSNIALKEAKKIYESQN